MVSVVPPSRFAGIRESAVAYIRPPAHTTHQQQRNRTKNIQKSTLDLLSTYQRVKIFVCYRLFGDF